MSIKGKLAYKIHQLQKRVNRDLQNDGHNPKKKTLIRLKRIKELKEELLNAN